MKPATRHILARALLFGAGALASTGASAQPLPTGLSFIAQDTEQRWAIYHAEGSGAPRRIATQLEPRQACIAPGAKRAIYSGADFSLRYVSLDNGSETMLARAEERRIYTQACMSPDGRHTYGVEMLDGKSVESDILLWREGAPAPQRVARQPGAQLEPFLHQGRWLVYASIGCSEGCERMLEEIWLRDLLTNQARQLTLLNAVSQAPVTDGHQVVFSSNASGAYKLWRVHTDGSGLKRLTDGADNDLQPALCGSAIFFIRSSPRGATLMRLDAAGTATELAVPGLTNFRALRCSA